MKLFNRLSLIGVVLSFQFFISCRKQIDAPIAEEPTSLPRLIVTPCKASTYGMYETNSGAWTTIAQKWYEGERVKFLKTHFSGRRPYNITALHIEPVLNIDWGEVTYEGNQVRVWDAVQNRLVFRVTIGESNRPVASYLYNQSVNANGDILMFIDTSYYYYVDNRIDYIIQIYEDRTNGALDSRHLEKYSFVYNPNGTITHYTSMNQRMIGQFVPGEPVLGMLSDYVLTTAFRLLEYLELARLPTNTTLLQFNLLQQDGPPLSIYNYGFSDYEISDRLVYSYKHPFSPEGGSRNYYIGWDCGATAASDPANRQSSIIKNLDQFKKLYPGSR